RSGVDGHAVQVDTYTLPGHASTPLRAASYSTGPPGTVNLSREHSTSGIARGSPSAPITRKPPAPLRREAPEANHRSASRLPWDVTGRPCVLLAMPRPSIRMQ